MKIIQFTRPLLLPLLFLIGTGFTMAEAPPPTDNPRWEKLGQRRVNRTVDRDEILVTARDGRFSAIKLQVRRSGINMHRLVVHYRNGQTHEVVLRNNLPAGGETRAVDLPGRKRVIRKVVFYYDTKGLINDKAIVELWGRR